MAAALPDVSVPPSETKTGRSPQGVDLASNFPRTKDKKTADLQFPVSIPWWIRTQPDPCYNLESLDSFQNIQLLLSCVGIWGTWRPFWCTECLPCSSWHSWAVFAELLSCCSQQVMVVAFICQPGSTLLSWRISPAQQGFASRTHPGYLSEGESLTDNALVLSSGQRSGCKHSSSLQQFQRAFHWFRRKHVSVPVNSSQ